MQLIHLEYSMHYRNRVEADTQSRYAYSPGLMCSFNRGNIEGTNTLKIYAWWLCIYIYVCEVIDFVDWLDGGLIHMWEEFRNVFAYDLSLTFLRWPCVVDRTLKSSYYYYRFFFFTQAWHCLPDSVGRLVQDQHPALHRPPRLNHQRVHRHWTPGISHLSDAAGHDHMGGSFPRAHHLLEIPGWRLQPL